MMDLGEYEVLCAQVTSRVPKFYTFWMWKYGRHVMVLNGWEEISGGDFFGDFHTWGYPQPSSIYRWFFHYKSSIFWGIPFMETLIHLFYDLPNVAIIPEKVFRKAVNPPSSFRDGKSPKYMEAFLMGNSIGTDGKKTTEGNTVWISARHVQKVEFPASHVWFRKGNVSISLQNLDVPTNSCNTSFSGDEHPSALVLFNQGVLVDAIYRGYHRNIIRILMGCFLTYVPWSKRGAWIIAIHSTTGNPIIPNGIPSNQLDGMASRASRHNFPGSGGGKDQALKYRKQGSVQTRKVGWYGFPALGFYLSQYVCSILGSISPCNIL